MGDQIWFWPCMGDRIGSWPFVHNQNWSQWCMSHWFWSWPFMGVWIRSRPWKEEQILIFTICERCGLILTIHGLEVILAVYGWSSWMWVMPFVAIFKCQKVTFIRVLNRYWAELLVQADLENFATITKTATLPMNLLIVMSKDGDTIIHSDSIGEGKEGDAIIHSDSIGEDL